MTRDLPDFVVGSPDEVTLTVNGGPLEIRELVPSNMTIVDANGGTVNGQSITWTNVPDGDLKYTVRPDSEGAEQFLGVAKQSNGVWLIVGGESAPFYLATECGWLSADISVDPTPGSATCNDPPDGTTFTIVGIGHDIWDAADDFHFLWKQFRADSAVMIQTRVDSLQQGVNMWSKVGIMFRTYATRESPFVYTMARADDPGALPDLAFQWRDDVGAAAAHDADFHNANQDKPFPMLIRAIYNRGVVTGYFAPDADQDGEPDEDWTITPTHELNLDGQSTVLGGVAVTSHNTIMPVTAEISALEVKDLGNIGISNLAASFSGDNVDLSWSVAGNIEEIRILRTLLPDTEGVGQEEIASVAGNATSYTDTTVPDDAVLATYTFVIVADGAPITGPSTGATRPDFVVLQEGVSPSPDYDGCQDAHIIYYRTDQGEWNTGGHNYIEEGDWGGGHGDKKEILIQFDLAGLSGSVSQAELWLYYAFQRNTGAMGQDHVAYAVPVLKEWNEGTGTGVDGRLALDGEVTWQSTRYNEESWESWDSGDIDWPCDPDDLPIERSGGAYGPEDVNLDMAVPCNESDDPMDGFGSIDGTWVYWNVTDIVNAWLSGSLPNNGLKITQQTTNSPCDEYIQGGYDFVSSNNVQAGLRPALILRTGGVVGIKVLVGDANGDQGVNIADAIYLLGYLFAGGPAPACMKAADTNDDNGVNIADAISILGYLFAGGSMTAPDGTAVTPANNTCKPYSASDVNQGGLGCAVQCK